jgi:hypothetical protein
MNMCHGKRRCTLSADPATFGNPCRPESRMYLKVVYTCGEYIASRGDLHVTFQQLSPSRFLLASRVKVRVTAYHAVGMQCGSS